ncbi:MAG: bifunctional (p)ppGpp synthetase/guanosine-3',5'-bis(diphosphate) 3'-pyrophosphohydrolase [Pseudomonadales bacterium]|jgi:GTP pyrophosphokinase
MVQVRKLQPEVAEGRINNDAWVEQMQSTLGLEDMTAIRAACELAQDIALRSHAEEGGDYSYGNCFFAGLEIAEILAGLQLDSDSLVAGILCRAVREERLSLEDVEVAFGKTVAKLIEGVQQMDAITTLHQPQNDTDLGGQNQIENVRKMLVAMVDDVRVALIKLAERTWAIRAIKNEPTEFKQRIARHVSEVYAPLAHRLGIGYIKWELEDIAFRYLEPERYTMIAKLLDGRRLDREAFISRVINLLEQKLRDEQIDASVTGRAKHIFSIARKMDKKHIDFDQVYDISAVRVLVPEIKDCYATLGIVHSLWRNIPNEFDDYIATPKPNGYRSLHTAVIGPEGKVMEVQIRTHAMHEEAEFGVCSHWQYKGTDRKGVAHSYEEKIDWLRQVLQWHEELGDISTLAEELRADVQADRAYVFTPGGHVVDLMNGATPVDFAYRVHTEVGNHCRGARVNGAIVSLNHPLKSGDQVEILTAEHATPRREWLNPSLGYIRESRTRSKIQHWFKLQDKEVNADAGQVMVEHEIQRLDLGDVDLETLAEAMDYACCEDMYADVGAGDLPVSDVMEALQQQLPGYQDNEQLAFKLADDADKAVALTTEPEERRRSSVLDAMTQLADCCKPVQGDDCLGYIKQGYGVTIHRRDCEKILQLEEEDPERIVRVDWEGPARRRYAIDILIRALDRHGLLHDITGVLTRESVNVMALSSQLDRRQGLVELRMTVEVNGLVLLGRLLDKIGQIPNLVEVKRCRAGS